MRVTRRGWGAALAGLFLLGLGLVLERPLLLVGGTLVGAGLVGHGYAFVRSVERTLDHLEIEQSLERERVVTDRQLPATLGVRLAAPASLHLDIESRPPVGTAISPDAPTELSIPPGGEAATTSYLAAWPHAGRFTFEAATVTAADPPGIFRARFAVGPEPSILVRPRAPRDIHVGVGGVATSAAYGEHAADRPGSGFDPLELREYQPGDAASRIDWKATARLAQPFVREFERETDRRTLLVVDHRASMAVGREGETKLDFAREVALAILASARALDDPLACYTVGDEGVTGRWPPDADRAHYAAIERSLGDLQPAAPRRPSDPTPGTSPARANRIAARLAADGTAFGRTLRPYFETASAYVDQAEGDPLYEAMRIARRRITGALWTVLITDDADPVRLRQTVSLAQRGPGRVLVLLTPTVLFEPGGLADLEAAYDRYVDFEELRRELARPDQVDAYEVAPGDRIGAVLTAGRDRRRRGERLVEGG